jgi:hypothetical protein
MLEVGFTKIVLYWFLATTLVFPNIVWRFFALFCDLVVRLLLLGWLYTISFAV